MKKIIALVVIFSSFSVSASTDSGDFTDLRKACYDLGVASAMEDRDSTLSIVEYIDQLPIHSTTVCKEAFKRGAIDKANQFLSDSLEENTDKK